MRGNASGATRSPSGTRISAEGPGVRLAATVGQGHDCLAVVVPWSQRKFQYTVERIETVKL